MRDHLHLFTSARFLPLFITQFLGALNDTTFKNSFLIWLTYRQVTATTLPIEILLAVGSGLFILPFVLFSPLAGEVADKYQKAQLCRLIKLCEIVLMLAASLAFFLKSTLCLMALLFLTGLQSTFFGPIKYSLLPEHLEKEELIGGNGLIETGTFLAILLGTIIGGVLIISPYGTVLLSLFLFLCAVVGWKASHYIPEASIGDPNLCFGFNLPRQWMELLRQAACLPGTFPLIFLISWFWFLGALFLMLLPDYTRESLQADETVVTLFLTTFSIGIGIGALTCNTLLKGIIHTRFVPAALGGMALGLALFYGATQTYRQALPSLSSLTSPLLSDLLSFFKLSAWSFGILGGLLLTALFGGLYIVPLFATLQHRTPDRCVARIIAANNIINALFIIGASLFALLLFVFHYNSLDVLGAAGLGTVGVFLLVLFFKERMCLSWSKPCSEHLPNGS